MPSLASRNSCMSVPMFWRSTTWKPVVKRLVARMSAKAWPCPDPLPLKSRIATFRPLGWKFGFIVRPGLGNPGRLHYIILNALIASPVKDSAFDSSSKNELKVSTVLRLALFSIEANLGQVNRVLRKASVFILASFIV